jgi:hypothetical protein
MQHDITLGDVNVECYDQQLETHVSVYYGGSIVKYDYKELPMQFVFYD